MRRWRERESGRREDGEREMERVERTVRRWRESGQREDEREKWREWSGR